MKCLPYKNKISFNEVKFMFIGRLSTGTNFEHTSVELYLDKK